MEILQFIADFFTMFAFSPELQAGFFLLCFLLMQATIIMFIVERFGK